MCLRAKSLHLEGCTRQGQGGEFFFYYNEVLGTAVGGVKHMSGRYADFVMRLSKSDDLHLNAGAAVSAQRLDVYFDQAFVYSFFERDGIGVQEAGEAQQGEQQGAVFQHDGWLV